jgi:hypothetical protein
VKLCLFQRSSPVWASKKLRNKFLSTFRKGRTDPKIYINVREFFDLIVYGLERGIDSIAASDISSLLIDEKFVGALWRTVTSRKIQYRLQITFIRARQSFIKAGAAESALPLPVELQSRLQEESIRQNAKAGAQALTSHSEDSPRVQTLEDEG